MRKAFEVLRHWRELRYLKSGPENINHPGGLSRIQMQLPTGTTEAKTLL
jgi:hypothetical protein